MRLGVTLISMAVIHWGIMSSGDPQGFYGSMFVFFAMMLVDYNSEEKYKNGYRATINWIYGFMCFISLLGVLKLLTVVESKSLYYVSVDSVMRLGAPLIINVHYLFLIMYATILIFSGIEAIFNVKHKYVKLEEVSAK